jgi:hypothetical protein
MCVYTYLNILCVYVNVFAYTCVHTHTRTHIHAHTHTHTHKHTLTYRDTLSARERQVSEDAGFPIGREAVVPCSLRERGAAGEVLLERLDPSKYHLGMFIIIIFLL